MGRIVVSEFISLDGVIEAPGGGEGFKHDGWTFDFEQGEEGQAFKLQEAMDATGLLLGRITYEGFAAAWPGMEAETGEFGKKMNDMPKWVVSSTLNDPEWRNSTVLEGDVAESVAKLRDEVDGDIYVNGSAQLVQTLIANDLVDQLNLMVFPVVLGSGKKLFADGEADGKKKLALKESKTAGDTQILIFEPAKG